MKANETRLREVRETMRGKTTFWEFLFMVSVLAFVLACVAIFGRHHG